MNTSTSATTIDTIRVAAIDDGLTCALCAGPIVKGAIYLKTTQYGFGAFEYRRVHTACEAIRLSDWHHADADSDKLKAIYFRDQLRRMKDVEIRRALASETDSEIARLLTLR